MVHFWIFKPIQFNSAIIQQTSEQASNFSKIEFSNFMDLYKRTGTKSFSFECNRKEAEKYFFIIIIYLVGYNFFWVLQIKWEYIGFTYCIFCIVACCALDAQPVLLSLVKYGCSRFALTRFNQKQYNSIQCYLKLNRKFTGCYRCYCYCCNDEHARNTHMWILQLSSLLICTL